MSCLGQTQELSQTIKFGVSDFVTQQTVQVSNVSILIS